MKKRCSKCQAILLDNGKQCPLCYHTPEENEAHYTLDDVQTIYVKRKNEKVFGPFPKAKVVSLVSSGKLEASEFISDDRENWIPVTSVQEFSALLSGGQKLPDSTSSVDLPGHKSMGESELPALKMNPVGLKSDLPDYKQPAPQHDLPALKMQHGEPGVDLPALRDGISIKAPVAGSSNAALPGLKTDLSPGIMDLPDVKRDFPAQVTNLPVSKSELPGQPTNLPGSKSELPGQPANLPGSKSELPGQPANLPGSKSELPGQPANLPGSTGSMPGDRRDLSLSLSDALSRSAAEDEDQDKNREFSLPPLGGGLVPEIRMDLNPGGMKPLEINGDSHGTVGSKKLEMPPSLFESSDHLDLSILNQKGSAEKSRSGLDLDHHVDHDPGAVAASQSVSDEETIPLTLDDEPMTDRRPDRPSQKRSDSGNRRVLMLIPLVLLLALAAAYQFRIGPFSGKSGSTKERHTMPTSPKPTAAVISEHEKNILNLDYPKLLASSRGDAMIHCESALILAWFYHEFEPLESCKKFLQTPINSTGDNETRRFQFFRALLLTQNPRQTQMERFFTGTMTDPVKVMEEILSASRSQNNRAPVWNFLGGVLQMVKKAPKKAREAFQLVNNTETTPSFGVTWFLARLGDESAISALSEKPENAIWNSLLKGFQYDEKNQDSFTFLAFPGEFPRIPVPEPAVLEKIGRRFRAINFAFSSLAAWEGGQLDAANSLCDKAIAEDEQDRTVWRLCSRMRLFHGQLGKFSTTVNLNQEAPTILAWIIEGRKNPALSAWEDLKKQDPAGSLVLAPLILMLSGAETEDVQAAIQAGLTADLPRTLEYLWTGVWQRPDLAGQVETAVLAWVADKKDETQLVKDFLGILTLVQALQAQDWKKMIQAGESLKIKGSTMLEIDGLVMMARMMDSKDNQAVIWADSQLQRVSPGARSAAALVAILGLAGKVQEAHQILDKYQEIFREPLFYKVAAQLYLSGTRKDRLMRSRFFAEKAIKANPQDAEALFLIGFIQLESGQPESGEKTIVQAVQAMNQPVHGWFMRWSELESRLKRPHMALAAMDAGLRKSPDYGPFLFKKAQILATQNNPKEALNLLEKTKDSGIEEVQRYILEGRCHVSLRQKREAETSFAKAVKANNKNILARYLLGKTLLANGTLRPAIPHLQFVAEELEKVLQDQIIPEEAAHWQTETVESMLAETCRLLGGAYKETGNRQMAIKYVKKYATLVPDGPMKDEALRLLLLLGGE
jgi:tetratricopeptide (TPR) repeat protein